MDKTMKKILILIPDMKIGGAQKSLVSFLNSLIISRERERFDIRLMVVSPEGPFLAQIPEGVRFVQPARELRWLGMHLQRKLFTEYFSWKGFLGELYWLLGSRLKRFPENLNTQQKLWECWKNRLPVSEEHYDTAISYMDGFSNYYLMEKIRADRKILWIHNEYQKQGCDPGYDWPFYEACQGIVTISEKCRECILEEFPEFANKTYVLQNITDPRTIKAAAEAGMCPEFDGTQGLRLLSVGRLSHIKGFDLAIEAAQLLRVAGVDFRWLVVGEGPERPALEETIIEKGLSECFRLIGSRENPYGYMRQCDILVQPSRSEGKSIVLDEAKCLCKPIVVTNYTTVSDSVCHGRTGWIVDMTPDALAEGILRVSQDPEVRDAICWTLKEQPLEVGQILNQYIQQMLGG